MSKTQSKLLHLIPTLALAFFLAACNGAGGAKNLEVSVKGGTPKKLDVKSGFIYSTPIGLSKNNEVKYASSYSFHIADYEQDGSRGMISLGETPKTDGTQVVFQIVGKEGGDAKTPIEPGDYPVAKPDGGPFQYKVTRGYGSSIAVFAGGKKDQAYLNESKTTGKVTIASVSGDEVSGTVDLNDGQNSFKGTFSAKMIPVK